MNNYRPIAIVIALSKIFELCIMRMIEAHLVTGDNQFGFKREHGTDLCIYTVKSGIKYYNLHNSPVHTCFLDASKAYNRRRVNYWTLFKKLLDRSVHACIFKLLECLCFGTLDKNYALGGELKCRHFLLFLME